jgi:dethiobiotin synthetase
LKYFITAIDTNVGKTVVSAILCKALNYSYWKPIQCGDLDNSDTLKVKGLVEKVNAFKETFSLKYPLSPHEAASLSSVNVDIDSFVLPTNDSLIIEGAGGLMVPLNDKGDLVIDIAKKFSAEIILVIKNYLGSINHSLLSLDYLKRNNFKIKGIVITGDSNPSSERIIEEISGCKIILRIPQSSFINEDFIERQALRAVKVFRD